MVAVEPAIVEVVVNVPPIERMPCRPTGLVSVPIVLLPNVAFDVVTAAVVDEAVVACESGTLFSGFASAAGSVEFCVAAVVLVVRLVVVPTPNVVAAGVAVSADDVVGVMAVDAAVEFVNPAAAELATVVAPAPAENAPDETTGVAFVGVTSVLPPVVAFAPDDAIVLAPAPINTAPSVDPAPLLITGFGAELIDEFTVAIGFA